MNLMLNFQDFLAIGPLLTLLLTSVLLLLVQSFSKKIAVSSSFYISLAGLLAALWMAINPATSVNPLLMDWLRFDGQAQIFTIFFLLIGIGVLFLSYSFFQRFEASQGEQ